jgi:hypothetical protein
MGRKDIHKDGKPFVKGDPRINRKGAPKKLPKLDEILGNVLGKENDQGITEVELIIDALKKKAKTGDVKSAQLLMDRGYGKVKEQIDITTNEESLNKPSIQIENIRTNKDGKK